MMLRILLLLLFVFWSGSAMAEAEELYRCPCRHIYPLQEAKFAFKGRLEDVKEVVSEGPGFIFRAMQLKFRVLEPWRGMAGGTMVTLKTDDTSCGYGEQLASARTGKTKIGQVFGVFAESTDATICNSVIMHESLLIKNRKEFR